VGLVQRKIEAAGFTTITLSNIPDLTAAVGAPRIAAIEYPIGLPLGRPGDEAGQTAVLRATLQALAEMEEPGRVRHLPFQWPEDMETPRRHRQQPPPIVSHLQRRPWLLPKFLSRDVPQ
jgi:hypothetical protein